MNIFKFEFKSYLKSNLVWTASLALVLLMFLSLFPMYSSQAVMFESLLKNFPEPFLKAMGLKNISFSVLTGYYSFTFVYIALIGGIFSARLGLDIISKELREKVGDFLLVKPTTRSKILISKFCAALTHIVLMNLVFILVAFILAHIFKQGDFNQEIFFLMNLSLFFIQFFFLCLSVMLATIFSKLKSVLPLSMGVVFGAYVVQLLNQTLDDNKISYLTPFGHFDAAKIATDGAYSVSHLFLSIVLSIIFCLIAYTVYNKKDIPSV